MLKIQLAPRVARRRRSPAVLGERAYHGPVRQSVEQFAQQRSLTGAEEICVIQRGAESECCRGAHLIGRAAADYLTLAEYAG